MRDAVIYARVSSKDQEREGFSIPAQLKFLREYASRNGFHITQEFIDVETAKTTGRKKFGEMLAFFPRNPGWPDFDRGEDRPPVPKLPGLRHFGRLRHRDSLAQRRASHLQGFKIPGQAEENQIQTSMQGLKAVRTERLLDAAKILELANKAYFLYVKQDHAERAKLLKIVLSNCGIDAVSLYPAYRKPFDLIFQKAKKEEWCARRDSNSRPSGS
jgi:Resolvase, N terminal domain